MKQTMHLQTLRRTSHQENNSASSESAFRRAPTPRAHCPRYLIVTLLYNPLTDPGNHQPLDRLPHWGHSNTCAQLPHDGIHMSVHSDTLRHIYPNRKTVDPNDAKHRNGKNKLTHYPPGTGATVLHGLSFPKIRPVFT